MTLPFTDISLFIGTLLGIVALAVLVERKTIFSMNVIKKGFEG